jgi:hypothetical protein
MNVTDTLFFIFSFFTWLFGTRDPERRCKDNFSQISKLMIIKELGENCIEAGDYKVYKANGILKTKASFIYLHPNLF